MTTTYEAVIDWLTCTFDGVRVFEELEGMLFGLWHDKHFMRVRASLGYLIAIENPEGIRLQSGVRPDMGTNMVCPGGSLSHLRTVMPTYEHDFKNVLRTARSVSRIDMAIDVKGTTMLSDLISMVRDGDYKCTAHTYSIIESADKGLTLYLGSRQSERMLRIYNKAAQLSLPGQLWERVELECKGSAAQFASRDVLKLGVPIATQTWIATFASFNHPVWRDMVNQAQMTEAYSGRKPSGKRDWIINVIAPIVAKRMMNGDWQLLDDFVEQVKRSLS